MWTRKRNSGASWPKWKKNWKRQDSRVNRYAVRYKQPFLQKDGYFKIRNYTTGALTQSGTSFDNQFAVQGGASMTASGDWTSIAGLYDTYEVLGYLWEFFPTQNVNQVAASNVNNFIPIFLCYDPDNILGLSTPPANINTVLQYENAKTFNIFSHFKYYIKAPMVGYNGANGDNPTISSAHIDPKTKRAVLDAATAVNNLSGVVYTRCDGLNAGLDGNQWGNILETWFIRAHSRR